MKGSGRVQPRGVVLDERRTIGPDASRTHIRFPFVLESGPARLEVTFSYDPRELSDERRTRELVETGMRAYGELEEPASGITLRNLLTLSLDGPSGFRGCAHRHLLSGPVLLSREAATPGFIPGPLEAGRWLATISVHSVVTERCAFTLRVRAI